MRGLTIVVLTADVARWDAALALSASHAALRAQTRLYLHDAAVRLIGSGSGWPTALELGVRVIACQTGLAAAGMALPECVDAGGLVSLLAELGEDRLVTI